MREPAATHGLWADLHDPDVAPANADLTVIGIPFDGMASARTGACQAPERIRFWSHHTTPFSEDRTRLKGLRVCDMGDVQVANPERDFEKVTILVAGLQSIPIVLGGDHSITIPVFRGQLARFKGKRLGVVWLDAHPDLCDEFAGAKLSHACVMRRGLESGLEPRDVCMVGLRSWEEQEIELVENGGLNVYTAADVWERGIRDVAADVRGVLANCDAIHVSLDIDCLDPAYAPGTGIPDSGGMTPRDVITLLRALRGLPLAGMDLVEVAPRLDPSEATVFAALKFIMECAAVIVRNRQEKQA